VALAYNPTIVSSGLVVAYDPANPKCYPGSGVTFYDLSGNNNHGTLTNGPTISNNLAKYTVFDGSNDYIVSANNTGIAVTSARTIMAWAWMGNVASSVIARIGASADNQAYEMQIYQSKLIMHRYAGAPSHVESTSSVKLNRWYHFAISYDGSNVKFYINGAYDGVSSLSLNTANAPLYVGSPVWGGNGHMSGNVSQVLLYNRELSATEINQNYNATKGRYAYTADIVTNGLILNLDAASALSYPGTGTSVYDVSTVANHATLINGPVISGSGSTLSFLFDGVDDYITGSFTSLSTNVWSCDMWFRRTSSQAAAPFNFSSGSTQLEIIISSTQINFWIGYDNWVNYVIQSNVWYHLCVVKTANNISLYANGVLISKLSDSRTYSIGGYILGKHPSVSANLLVGNYANVKFYNRALESFEVQQNYDAMRGRYS